MYCFYFSEKGAFALCVFEAVYCFITWAFVLLPILYYLRYSIHGTNCSENVDGYCQIAISDGVHYTLLHYFKREWYSFP